MHPARPPHRASRHSSLGDRDGQRAATSVLQRAGAAFERSPRQFPRPHQGQRAFPRRLAKLREDSEELSLCFDPTSDAIGAFDDGQPLFEGKEPSQLTKDILAFNETFEQAGQRTQAFMKELKDLELLMDGEVSIQPEGAEQPFLYRGFQMVNEQKLQQMRGDQLRKMNQSGMLPLIYAHLFSLSLMRDVFAKQVGQGKMPQPQLQGF